MKQKNKGIEPSPSKPMVNVRVVNSVQATTAQVPLSSFMEMVMSEELISVREFLQRTLVRDEWFKDNYKVSREYLSSLFRGTASLDTFSIVPLDLIVMRVREVEQETNDKAYTSALKRLNQIKKQGAKFVSLDGQSRSELALKPYWCGDIEGLGDTAHKISLEIDGKSNKTLLADTPYPKLPVNVKEFINKIKIPLTIVEDFYEFNDIIDSLVDKQKGFSWSDFQVTKQRNRFKPYVSSLIDIFGTKEAKEFSELWGIKMGSSLKKDFRLDRDGQQYFSIIMSILLEKGMWRQSVDNVLSGPDAPTKQTFKRIFKYCIEYFNHHSKNDIRISEIINWVVFRWTMEGGTRQSLLNKSISFTRRYNVSGKNVKKLYELFYKHHITIKGSKDKPHDLSWIEDPLTGEQIERQRPEGYSHALRGQNTDNITHRMRNFMESFDWDFVENKGIVSKHDPKKPTVGEILLNSDFKEVYGEPVDITDLSDYDISHFTSKYNGGSDSKDNVGLERKSANRRRGSENLVVEKK